jgi:hypothetical protein
MAFPSLSPTNGLNSLDCIANSNRECRFICKKQNYSYKFEGNPIIGVYEGYSYYYY